MRTLLDKDMTMVQYKDVFKIKHNSVLPSKGKLLISEPFLQDAYFQRSVVLLVEHGERGSMGLVLNKRIGFLLNDFFEGFGVMPRLPVFLGGPVASERLFFIHTLGNSIPGSTLIDGDIYFDGDFECLLSYLRSGVPLDGKVKFFLGYSGWTENQLKTEIESNSWLVSRQNKNILRGEGESFWKYAVQMVGGRYKNWVNYPKDPRLN
ncbi:MAG: YqgE/AlgH family protein [Tannerella sp.]|nr:YqgE/AlgH family protein [Tannerella sp.]